MLKINELFCSIQGESTRAGHPFVFIRLTGCNLRCSYCDTRNAFRKGKLQSIDRIVASVKEFGCFDVEITGGEPLLQEETPRLAETLLREGFRVLVETNGTRDIGMLPQRVVRIMDIKCPGSREHAKTDWRNIERLRRYDEVKFVLTGFEDYLWTKDIIAAYGLLQKAEILLSPVLGKCDPANLAEWILRDRLPVRLQIQLHKILWPNHEKGR